MEFEKTQSATRKYTITQAKLDLKAELTSAVVRDSRDNYALLWIGEGGIGKSSVIRDTAAEVGCEYRSWHHGATIEEDNHGVQYRDGDITRWSVPEHLESIFDLKGKKGLMFIDEIYSGQTMGHQNFVRMLIDRQFHNRKIDPGWVIIGATNPENSDYMSVRSVDLALSQRMLVYEIDPSNEELLEYWHLHMPEPVRGFIKHYHFSGNLTFVKAMSPRNWMKLARAIERRLQAGFSIEQVSELMLSNATPELSASLAKYMRIGNDPMKHPLSFADIIHGNWGDRMNAWIQENNQPLIAASQWNLLLEMKRNPNPQSYADSHIKMIARFLEALGAKHAELAYNVLTAMAASGLCYLLLTTIKDTELSKKLNTLLGNARASKSA